MVTKMDRVMRLPEVLETVGLSRSRIYVLMADGTFPAPMKIGVRAVGWRESVIRKWLRDRDVPEAA